MLHPFQLPAARLVGATRCVARVGWRKAAWLPPRAGRPTGSPLRMFPQKAECQGVESVGPLEVGGVARVGDGREAGVGYGGGHFFGQGAELGVLLAGEEEGGGAD